MTYQEINNFFFLRLHCVLAQSASYTLNIHIINYANVGRKKSIILYYAFYPYLKARPAIGLGWLRLPQKG